MSLYCYTIPEYRSWILKQCREVLPVIAKMDVPKHKSPEIEEDNETRGNVSMPGSNDNRSTKLGRTLNNKRRALLQTLGSFILFFNTWYVVRHTQSTVAAKVHSAKRRKGESFWLSAHFKHTTSSNFSKTNPAQLSRGLEPSVHSYFCLGVPLLASFTTWGSFDIY